MGFLTPERRKDEEEPGGGAELDLDLDLKACPDCGRELMPWEAACPEDGATAVPKRGLVRRDLPTPPAHLMDDDATDGADDATT